MDVQLSLSATAVVAVAAAALCVAIVQADARIRDDAWSPPSRVARTIGSAVMPAALVGSAMTVLGVLSALELLLRL